MLKLTTESPFIAVPAGVQVYLTSGGPVLAPNNDAAAERIMEQLDREAVCRHGDPGTHPSYTLANSLGACKVRVHWNLPAAPEAIYAVWQHVPTGNLVAVKIVEGEGAVGACDMDEGDEDCLPTLPYSSDRVREILEDLPHYMLHKQD